MMVREDIYLSPYTATTGEESAVVKQSSHTMRKTPTQIYGEKMQVLLKLLTWILGRTEKD